ncbi:MAG TPA: hypothetical protein VEW69_13375 [Alphaproteobacteria bacterium]|nr:hypothetical protein [Alphaproteobacteria bacterium]
MNPSHSILIIADDPAFSRDLVGHWQRERVVPAFTVMSTELFHEAVEDNFDLAVVGPVRTKRLASVIKALDVGANPVICLLKSSNQAETLRADYPRTLFLQQNDGWLDSALLLATECLKRVDLTRRLKKADDSAALNSRQAALGRYMLENRHDFNNQLTSVLGNAELLLQESDVLEVTARDQLESIRDSALNMYELMQRFSSITIEMRAAEKASQTEMKAPSQRPVPASSLLRVKHRKSMD